MSACPAVEDRRYDEPGWEIGNCYWDLAIIELGESNLAVRIDEGR